MNIRNQLLLALKWEDTSRHSNLLQPTTQARTYLIREDEEIEEEMDEKRWGDKLDQK